MKPINLFKFNNSFCKMISKEKDTTGSINEIIEIIYGSNTFKAFCKR